MLDLTGPRGAVATSDPLAAQAGAEILRRGGNAIDAAVATMLTECVANPANVGIAGYGGCAVVFLARERRVVSIDFDSVAPFASAPDMFEIDPEADDWQIESGTARVVGRRNEHGYLAVSTPGVVAGLAHMLRRCGTMSWAEASEPAIRYAENGFPLSAGNAASVKDLAENADEVSRRAFLPDGDIPSEGEPFVQRDLAETLRTLAHEGPDAFYGSDIAGRIVKQIAEHGGVLQMADFASYSPVESDPIALECGGYELHTPPLPSGGVTSLQIVRAMHEADPPLPPLGKGGQWGGQADYYHLLIEISKLAWLDRIHECGDPAFIDDPTWRLLGSAHTIDLIASAGLAEPSGAPVGAPGPAGCTVHTVAADAGGNFVSLTATQGGRFGSRVVIDGLGLIVGHGMSRFDPVPGRPNSIAPGKRVLHNMSPMILTRGGEIAGAFGLPGGRKIVNVAAQMALSFVEFGLTPSQAVNAPRIHTEGREPVTVTGLSPEVIESLTSRGHRIESIQGRIGGPACAIMLDRETGCLLAASERGPGCVAVVV